MLENQDIRPVHAIGPVGQPLSLEALPPSNTVRWVVRRKAEVVAAVVGLPVHEACQRYSISLEEFTCWQRALDRQRHARAFNYARSTIPRPVRARGVRLTSYHKLSGY